MCGFYLVWSPLCLFKSNTCVIPYKMLYIWINLMDRRYSRFLIDFRVLLNVYCITLMILFFTLDRTFERSLIIVSAITSEYSCVVVSFVCPKIRCTVVIGTPWWHNKVAHVWRAVWKVVLVFIMAFCWSSAKCRFVSEFPPILANVLIDGYFWRIFKMPFCREIYNQLFFFLIIH